MRHRNWGLAAAKAFLCVALMLTLAPLTSPLAQAQQASGLQEIKNRGAIKVGWAVVFPYMYRDPKTTQLTGFAVDFMDELGAELKVKVEWVEDNWSTMIAGIQSGKFDVTLPGLAITLPRAQAVTYTKPVARQPLGLMVRKQDVEKYKSWSDLDKPDKRVTTTLGSNVDMFATKKFSRAQIVRVKAGPDSIAQMLTGKADAWANALEAFKLVEQEHPELTVVPGPTFGSSPIAMAVRQGDFIFRDWLNLFIDEQTRTGSLKKLVDKHGLYEWKEQEQ